MGVVTCPLQTGAEIFPQGGVNIGGVAEGSDHLSYGRILISRFCGLERQVGLAGPVGIDRHTSDSSTACTCASTEEGAREPGNVVLLHGDIEVALGYLDARSVEGTYREVDGTLGIVQEGVEVELLVISRNVELYVLLAIHGAEAGFCIECARASCVVEAELLDIGGYLIVGQHKATKGRDTVERDLVVDLLLTNGDRGTTEVGIGVARTVGELDLGGVCHRRVATGAMTHDHQGVVTFSELEGGLAEIGFGRGLVDLLDAGAIGIIDGEIQAGAGLRGRGGLAEIGCGIYRASERAFRPSRQTAEGRLLDAEDGDGEVGVFVSGRTADHTIVLKDGLLAGEEQQGCA